MSPSLKIKYIHVFKYEDDKENHLLWILKIYVITQGIG